MSLWTNSLTNALLNEMPAIVTHCSLHTAWPSDTGADEVTGGGYARQALSNWGSASGGVIIETTAATFDMTDETVAFCGFWSAVSAGTFYAYHALGGFAPIVCQIADQLVGGGTDCFLFDINESAGTDAGTGTYGIVDTNRIYFRNFGGDRSQSEATEELSGGNPTEGTLYFVRDRNVPDTLLGGTFRIAATSGGTALALDATRATSHQVLGQAVVPQTISGVGQYVVTTKRFRLNY